MVETPQDPTSVFEDFAKGNVAIAMLPVNRHWDNVDGNGTFPATTLGPVPGWNSLFDGSRGSWTEQLPGAQLNVPLVGSTGMLVSASSGTQQQRNAIEVIVWMTSKQMSSILSVESPNTGLSRKVHLADPEKWLGPWITPANASQFSDYMNELNRGRRILMTLRIPEADRYLDVLDEAVRQTIIQDGNAVENLSTVAKHWSEIINEIGLEEQKQSYRRSEGLRN